MLQPEQQIEDFSPPPPHLPFSGRRTNMVSRLPTWGSEYE
jgi:hypothetical protein